MLKELAITASVITTVIALFVLGAYQLRVEAAKALAKPPVKEQRANCATVFGAFQLCPEV